MSCFGDFVACSLPHTKKETAVEISDEVVEVAVKAFKKSRDYEFDTLAIAMRETLQAAIPLVVQGLVPTERKGFLYADESRSEQYEAAIYDGGYNACRQEILAKVKK
jgi:hypothetical protein